MFTGLQKQVITPWTVLGWTFNTRQPDNVQLWFGGDKHSSITSVPVGKEAPGMQSEPKCSWLKLSHKSATTLRFQVWNTSTCTTPATRGSTITHAPARQSHRGEKSRRRKNLPDCPRLPVARIHFDRCLRKPYRMEEVLSAVLELCIK